MIPKSVEVGPSKTDIQLSYEDGRTLLISSVFLRKFSPTAENKKNLMDDKIKQFQGVLINKIESVGNYAIRVHFNDGHNTGIYSWDYLLTLGEKFKNL